MSSGLSFPHSSTLQGPRGLGSFYSAQQPEKEDEVTSSEEISVTDTSQTDLKSSCPTPLPKPAILDLSCLSSEGSYESAAKLLYLSVRWARSVPSFQQLCARDQNILLEEAWSSLFVLSSAQWFLPVDEVRLLRSCAALPARHPMLEEDARQLKDVISRLTGLRVDHTEYACLKALVLFKAEKRGLREPYHIELLQDQTHVMLQEYCSMQHKARFGKLLLSLLWVGSINKQSLQELFFQRSIGNVPVERLLKDLQAQHLV